MRWAGSVWHRTPIYSRSQGVLCKRPAVFWRALGVQPLGNKAINKYVQLETEATQGIDPRGRFENMISYWSPENYLCKSPDLASACETKDTVGQVVGSRNGPPRGGVPFAKSNPSMGVISEIAMRYFLSL